uniref:Transcriptional regulator n=1 Tax=Parastrongyloides trichosuri TaxID=131310 RepID=A0A0N4ZVS0_PARTI
MLATHGRQDFQIDEFTDFLQDRLGVHTGQIAVFKLEFAQIRHRIQGDTAPNHAGLQGGEGHIEIVVVGAHALVVVGQITDGGNDACRMFNRVHTLGGQRGMSGMTMYAAAISVNAFMRHDGAHTGGFTHHAAFGFHATTNQIINHDGRADTTDFFVVGVSQVDGFGQLGRQHFRNQLQRHTDKAFHVASAAAIQTIVADFGLEGVTAPVLTVDGHHIALAAANRPARHESVPG